jgi:hypothetical protein
MSECQFEQQPLYCSDCGAYIGVLGTCEDFAQCDRCASRILRQYDEGARQGFDVVYSPEYEETKQGELVHTKNRCSRVAR